MTYDVSDIFLAGRAEYNVEFKATKIILLEDIMKFRNQICGIHALLISGDKITSGP